MIRKCFWSLLLLSFGVGLPLSHAQFEGQIIFNTYMVTGNDSRELRDQFSMHVTKDRILLEGENQYNIIGSIQTKGILVRLDFNDFIFLTDDNTALKISKQDITSMMNMLGNGSAGGGIDPGEEVDYQQTGEVKSILGYTCEKFIFTEKGSADNYASVWLTKELDLHWGMLSEPWGSGSLDMLGENISSDLVFKKGYFPLLMEVYRDGELREVTEASEVSKTRVAKARVQVPSGVKVLSFQDYLFNKMSQ